jgi:signal peptidase II
MAVTRPRLWGPLSALGFALAVLSFASDQAFKWWMLDVVEIAVRQPITITPFLQLVLAWNKGVSYGLFPQDSLAGQHLLIVLSILACILLWLWLARTDSPPTAAALGLIIGGAFGNALDRILYDAVADFFLFHAFGYSWYVFNVADIAIVVGVGLLLYEAFHNGRHYA